MKASTTKEKRACPSPRLFGETAFRLPDEPGRAEERVAGNEAEPAEERERRRPVERAAGEGAVRHADSLDEPAEDHALAEGGDDRAAGEGDVPTAWRGFATQRNSKETPRKMSASSMTMTGR